MASFIFKLKTILKDSLVVLGKASWVVIGNKIYPIPLFIKKKYDFLSLFEK